jgi:chromodomain-helicase-DNA-binding protein 4
LFNLLNFLDPDQWGDLKTLEKQYEELTEDLVKTLHTRLRPYFLRRIKTEVLQLPPKVHFLLLLIPAYAEPTLLLKNEVIVPVSMTPLQKEIYRSILSQNLDVLKFLSRPTTGTRSGKNNIAKANLNNMLMQLRK